jgi:hypothetical protein
MSTTTDRAGYVRRGLRFAGAALLVTAIWFAALAVAELVAEPTRTVLVFGPKDTTFKAVAESSGQLVDSGQVYIIAHGQQAGFVSRLYASGAWLVLPALGGGCRRPRRA